MREFVPANRKKRREREYATMELMQLEMFVAVVEERSVRKAAERVFRTQPAISISLGKLASEIGTPLIEGPRGGGRRLTQAGEVLYEYALQILGLRDEALSRLKTEHRGHVHVCTGVPIAEKE